MNDLDIEPIHTPALAALEQEFVRLSAAAQASGTPRIRTRRIRTRRRWMLPAAATSLAGIAAVLAVGVLSVGGVQPAPASALERVADVVEHAPDSHLLGPGQYWYVRTQAQTDDQRSVVESWQDANGVVRTRITPLATGGRPTETTSTGQGFALGLFSYDELLALPTDPAALLERIGDAIDQNKAWTSTGLPLRVYELQAIWLLLDSPGTPELRAALFRAAALVPGVRSVGAVTDPLGRNGEAVVDDAPGTPVQLTYDPSTGNLLSLRGGRTRVSVIATGGVDSIHGLPAGVARVGD
jgi:hypothetical protein